MAATSFVALKITEDETQDIRRISVTVDATVSALRAKLSTLFSKDLSATKIQYLDSDNELVTIVSDEELAEAFRLANLKETPVLNITLRAASKSAQANPCQQQTGASPCDGCPISKFFRGFCRPGAAGARGGRRCCPGKIIKCVLLAIFAFKIVSFLAFHFFWLAILALPFIAIRAIRRRYQRRAGNCGRWAAGRGCPRVQQDQGVITQLTETRPEDVVPVAVPAQGSSTSAESSRQMFSVVETDAAGNLSGASRFSKALNELEGMGFVDKTKNIEALIATNLDLNRSIQRLLV